MSKLDIQIKEIDNGYIIETCNYTAGHLKFFFPTWEAVMKHFDDCLSSRKDKSYDAYRAACLRLEALKSEENAKK